MKIKYIVKSIKDKILLGLTENEQRYFDGFTIPPDSLHLTLDKEYTILGIDYTNPMCINFMLVDDTEVDYPKFYPSEFFVVTDNRTSRFWVNRKSGFYPIEEIQYPVLISFDEAVTQADFFDKLINGDEEAIETFKKYKKLIENEFPDKSLKTAEVIGDGWVMCAYCGEVWRVDSHQGIIVCPKNSELNNNPLWRN
jgi:hypothetical protein